MSELNIKDLEGLKELATLRREKPEEYKQFFKDIKEIMKDLIKVAKEISEEMEDE